VDSAKKRIGGVASANAAGSRPEQRSTGSASGQTHQAVGLSYVTPSHATNNLRGVDDTAGTRHLVYFVRYFKHYLLGRKFLIRTDHSALRWLRRTPEAIGQQARWLEILEGFDYDIIHRAGRLHGNADAMSRVPCRQCQMSNAEAETLVRTVTIIINVNHVMRKERCDQ
jgi:hypothetical protein